MTDYFGLFMKWQYNFMSVIKQCLGSYKKMNFRAFELGEIFASISPMFCGLSNKIDMGKVIIQGAWSQCQLRKEKAHATL